MGDAAMFGTVNALRAENEALKKERDDERREHEYYARQVMAFTQALKTLPDVPPVPVLAMLDAAGTFPGDWERGKAMQRQHGLEAIPPKTEYEQGAGVWSRLLSGFRAEAARTAAEAKAARLEEALKALVDRPLSYHGAVIHIPADSHGDAIARVTRARAELAASSHG